MLLNTMFTFQTVSLKGWQSKKLKEACHRLGQYFIYPKRDNKVQHITAIQYCRRFLHVWMDRFTIRTLNSAHSYVPNAVTLSDVIDKTLSPMVLTAKRWLVPSARVLQN
jgi:DNA mismatch repair protein MutS